MDCLYNYKIDSSFNLNLSFLVDVAETKWFSNGAIQNSSFLSPKLKEELPDNTLFNISSLIFNIETHQQQELNKYFCFYQKSTDSLCIVIEETAQYVNFSKEIILNMMDFAQKLGIMAIILLIARKNKDYVKLLQGMMTVGFEHDQQVKTTKIDGKMYKVLKLSFKNGSEEIQEVEF